jgi:serine/threonine protein kinase
MKAGRILIVENDPLWQEFLQDPLTEEYFLTVVSNRAEAEQALNEAKTAGNPFNVVTVDIGLEHDVSALDGENILALVSQHHRNTKCIVVSGHHSVGTTKLRNYFKKFDVFDYVGKADFDLLHFKQVIDDAFLFHGYRILQVLGRGGMGTVYKALDPEHDNRIVALKVLHSGSGLSPEAAVRRIARFAQEVETIRRLEHPYIVKVYDYLAVEEAEGQAFFVMEYLDGLTLEAVLARDEALSQETILHLGIQLGEALAYAHQQQIVHRDVKPSNVMLLPNNQIKITDFGIAKVLDTSSSLTKTEEIIGTLDYMPPEQILHTKEVDHRVDIYATGVMLFEMLGRQKPYSDPLLKLQFAPTPLREINPAVPVALAEVVMKTLAQNADERYQSAAGLAEALCNLI